MKIQVKRFEGNYIGYKFKEVIVGYFTIQKIEYEEIYLNFINQGFLPRPY